MRWLDLPRMARLAFISTKKNAAKRGIDFMLTKDDMAALWAACEGKCAVSGVPLELDITAGTEWRRNPWRPSIDRIESREGYAVSNCRIVCVAANIAMNEWGVEVLRRLAHGMFGSDVAPILSKAGTGYLRGIGKRTYKGEPRFVVRISVNGKPKEFGTFRDYEKAVKRLQEVRANSAVRLSLGNPASPENTPRRRAVY